MQEAPGRKRTDIFESKIEYVHNSRPQACPHLEGADQTATYLNVSCRIWPCPGPPIVNVSCCIWVVRVRGRQGRRQTYRNVSRCIVCWFSHQEHGNRTYRMYPGVSALHGEGSRERIQTYPVVSCANSGLACWTYLNVSWGIWWKRFAPCKFFEPLTIRPQTSNRGPLPIQT